MSLRLPADRRRDSTGHTPTIRPPFRDLLKDAKLAPNRVTRRPHSTFTKPSLGEESSARNQMIELRMLGSLEVKLDNGQSEVATSQPKRAALLTYLAMARPVGFHRRDTLLALLWPELDAPRARHALSQALYGLRSALGEDAIVSRGDAEIGLDRSKVWCDVTALDAALDAGESQEALDLYRGPLLHGFHVSGALEFERWLEAERADLHERVSEVGWSLAELEQDPVEAARMARRAAGFSPYDEGVLRRLITFLDQRGDRPGAIRVYEAFVARLAEDLEVEPSEATTALVEKIAARQGERAAVLRARTPRHAGAPGAVAQAADVSVGESAASEAAPPPVPGPWYAYIIRHPLRVTMATVIVFAAVVVALGSRPRFLPPIPQSFVVFPFTVTTDDSSLVWLRRGAASMLANDLDSWEEIRMLDRRRLAALADSLEISLDDDVTLTDALTVARAGRAETMVLGELLGHAGQLEIVVRQYDTRSGDPFGQVERATGAAGDDVRPLVDGIAARILDLRGAADSAPDLRAATTYSLAAYRDFLRGMDEFYSWEIAEAADAFRSAIAQDSTFAEAYYRLAVSLEWMPGRNYFRNKLGDTEESCRLTNAAVRHGARLPVKAKRHVEAYNAYVCEPDVQLARQLYREILTADSSDAEAWFHLANVEFWDEGLTRTATGELYPRMDLNLALTGYLRAVELDPSFHLGYGEAFYIYSILNTTAFGAWDVTGDFLDKEAPLDQVYFYTTWQDSIRFVPMDPTRYEEIIAPFVHDSASRAVKDSAIIMARRWTNAAPDLAAPHGALRELYIERRAYDLALEEENVRFRLSRNTAIVPTILGSTAEDQHLGWRAMLHLALGHYDSALTLAEQNLARQQQTGRTVPITTASILVALGQPRRALDEVTSHFDPGRYWVPGTGDSAIDFTESVPLLWQLQLLGSAGAGDARVRAVLDSLNRKWSTTYEREDSEVLRWMELTFVGPALLVLDRATSEQWFALAADPDSTDETRIKRAALVWRPYLALIKDSLPEASRALEALVDRIDGTGFELRPTGAYAAAAVARELERHALAVRFYQHLDGSTRMKVNDLDARWGLLTLSYLRRAQSYEALQQHEQAVQYYRRFVAAWNNAEPDLQRYANEARRALDRLARQ